MTTDRRSYTDEFKREAVRLMETSSKSVAQIARELATKGRIQHVLMTTSSEARERR